MASVKHHTSSAWDKSPVRFAAAAVILLLLHAPLVFLRAPDNHSSRLHLRRSNGAVVALPPGDSLSRQPRLRDLFRWAEMADCSMNYLQTQKQGYLQFVPARPPRTAPPFPELQLKQLPSPAFTFASREISHESLPAEQFILRNWPDFLPLAPAENSVDWQQGVFWRRYGMGPLKNPPRTDRRELEKALAGADLNSLRRTTVLEIILLPELRIPRVLVRQSCGIPALDLLATRMIRNELEKTIRNKPELRNNPARITSRVQADWRLPLTKPKTGGRQ